MKKPTVYIASPLGFSETGRHFMYEKFIPKIKEAGYETINPWDLTTEEEVKSVLEIEDETDRLWKLSILNGTIGERNEEAIRETDGMIAVLDGQEVDSGTASEIGFAYGLNKHIVGYRNDFRLASENNAAKVNLQVQYFVLASGGDILYSLNDLKSYLKKSKEKFASNL